MQDIKKCPFCGNVEYEKWQSQACKKTVSVWNMEYKGERKCQTGY